MSSRFVSAGTSQALSSTDEDWDKARAQVESKRNEKPVETGTQEGGKSLYEVLQANKAAKQEAFEEAAKVRNQFRALDDSEVEFLDSIRESERANENSVRQETAAQLNQFRKQQAAADRPDTDSEAGAVLAERKSVNELWATSKKRRREKEEGLITNKLIKPTSYETVEVTSDSSQVSVLNTEHRSTSPLNKATTDVPVAALRNEEEKSTSEGPKSIGLGLGAYDSDDE